MAGVSIKIIGSAGSLFDSPSYTVEVKPGMTMRELLAWLSRHAGVDFAGAVYDIHTDKMNEYIVVFVNTKEIRTLDGLDTKLKEGDVITVLPPMAGG